MADGIEYTTEAELIDSVKTKIFPNGTKAITGAAHQQAVLDMIVSMWRETGTVDLQDLQSVLDEGAVADITGPFNLTAQGVNLVLGSGGVNTTWSVGVPNSLKVGSSLIEMIADTGGTTAKLGVSPSGVSMEGSNPGSGGKVFVDAGAILIGGNNSTDGSVHIHGNARVSEGMGISRNITPPTNTALWDIDGDLAVRGMLDNVSDTKVVTIDNATGLTHKDNVGNLLAKTKEYTFLNTSPGYNVNDAGNYSVSTVQAGQTLIIFGALDDTKLGEYKFTCLPSVDVVTLGFAFPGNTPVVADINENEYVIFEATKYITSTGPDTFNYRYEEVRRGSIVV